MGPNVPKNETTYSKMSLDWFTITEYTESLKRD